MKKIGILTSGGDCQGLNAAIRGVAKTLYHHYNQDNVEIYGINDGYKGLINCDYKIMSPEDFTGIIDTGGTILGTSRQPFKSMRIIESGIDKVKLMKETYKKLGLDCLVVLGGNGTHKTANLLSQEKLNVVSLPKTIDNDLYGTDITFGFQSAVDIATTVIDGIHTTAQSHGRVFIIELMGHKAGWLTLYAGIAGGADIILIPEIPYNIDSIVSALKSREAKGKKFSIIALAEGALPQSKNSIKKDKKSKNTSSADPYNLAKELESILKHEVRVVVPGHFQRGGRPSPCDRVLATRFGVAAANLIINKDYGKMVALKGTKIIAVKLSEVAGKLKTVPVDSEIIQTARDLGLSFGD